MRITHTRTRYIYDLYYQREAISKELYDWLCKEQCEHHLVDARVGSGAMMLTRIRGTDADAKYVLGRCDGARAWGCGRLIRACRCRAV